MKHLLTLITIVLVLGSCTKDRNLTTPTGPTQPNSGNRTLIDYWNFNSSATDPTVSNVAGAILSYDFATVSDTTGYYDFYTYATSGTSNINAQNGDPLGTALRVRNPVTDFIIAAPTTGYNNILVSYSEAKSSNGPGTNTVYYTLDGTNYIIYPGASATYTLQVDPAYTLESFDFTSITGANNNPNFKVKIVFSNGNLATSGNDRFDNLTIQGNAIGNNSSGNKPVISSAATASGTVNIAFAGYTITASNTPTSYALTGNIPAGLSINTTTGVISGTPTASGTFVDTVKATNASGTGSQVLTITIAPAATITLLHYWNFNALPNFITPTHSIISGAGLTFDYTTVSGVTGYTDSLTASSTNGPGGSTYNLQNSDTAGNALRIRNPCLDFIISAPTTGYQNITLNFAAEASSASKAALTNSISYTVDGTNYITTGLSSTSYSLSAVIDPAYALETVDFSTIAAVNNNPNFKVKITFSNGNLGTSGNDRFDNITVQGFHQ